ncbi:MAG: alpha/beta fold hydrolase [Rhodobacterales bacterium]|nr:alpha/beta fold hydrolase [Rhodobacterales bacterium]
MDVRTFGRPWPAHPSFHPSIVWRNGDLQTLRNTLFPPYADLETVPVQRLVLDLDDGSGDRLAAELNPRPARKGHPPAPLVVILHGLTGNAHSRHVKASAAHLWARGFSVLRLNLRGAGASARICADLYHAGRSDDLAAALRALPRDLTRGGLYLLGYSLGGNMMLKFLGENHDTPPVAAAAAVSAPLDLSAAQATLAKRRNRFYQNYLLKRMKREALGGGVRLGDDERQAIREARSVRDYDDRFVAPRNGFDGAADYYARCSSGRYLDTITTRTLLVHAMDDPWIPADVYQDRPWSPDGPLTHLLSDRGGHVGFHDHDSRVAWHDRCVSAFFLERGTPHGNPPS